MKISTGQVDRDKAQDCPCHLSASGDVMEGQAGQVGAWLLGALELKLGAQDQAYSGSIEIPHQC